MPEFRHPTEIAEESSGAGWTLSALADARHIAGLAMSAKLWRLAPGTTGPEQEWNERRERFLYIVDGAGTLLTGGGATPLGREDMVWIEPGDAFRLRAEDDQPLTVLDATSG